MKKFLLLLLLLIPRPSFAAYSFIVSTNGASSDTQNATTGDVTTSGADFCAVGVTFLTANSYTVTDNKSNTFSQVPTGFYPNKSVWYKQGLNVGSGHHFIFTGSAGSMYPVILAVCFSGSVASPFDQFNENSFSSATSAQPGSATPSENGELLILLMNTNGMAPASMMVDSGFTIAENVVTDFATHIGGTLSYLIQGTAGAVNPQYTWTSAGNALVDINTFKAGTGGGGGGPFTSSVSAAGAGK